MCCLLRYDQELKSMFKAGTINGDTRVWTDGMPDWAELSTTAYVS